MGYFLLTFWHRKSKSKIMAVQVYCHFGQSQSYSSFPHTHFIAELENFPKLTKNEDFPICTDFSLEWRMLVEEWE